MTDKSIDEAVRIINAGFSLPVHADGKRAVVYLLPIDAASPLSVPDARRLLFARSVATLLIQFGYDVRYHCVFAGYDEVVNNLTVSIWLRYLELCGEQVPYVKACYQGDYIFDFAAAVHRTYGDRWRVTADELAGGLPPERASAEVLFQQMRIRLGDEALSTIKEIGLRNIHRDIANDLREIGVDFDQWPGDNVLADWQAPADCFPRLAENSLLQAEGSALYLILPDTPKTLLQSETGPTPFALQLSDFLSLFKEAGGGGDLTLCIYDIECEDRLENFLKCVQSLGQSIPIKLKPICPPRLFELGELVHTSPLAEDYVSFREARQTIGLQNVLRIFTVHQSAEAVSVDLAKANNVEFMDCNDILQNTSFDNRNCVAIDKLQTALKALSEPRRQLARSFFQRIAEYPAIAEQAKQTLEPALIVNYYRKLCETSFSYYNNHQLRGSDLNQGEKTVFTTMATALHRLAKSIEALWLNTGSKPQANQNSTR